MPHYYFYIIKFIHPIKFLHLLELKFEPDPPKLALDLAGEDDAVAVPPNDLNSPLNANTYFSLKFFKSFIKLSYFNYNFSYCLFFSLFFYALLVAIRFYKFVISVFCFPLKVFNAVYNLACLFISQVYDYLLR